MIGEGQLLVGIYPAGLSNQFITVRVVEQHVALFKSSAALVEHIAGYERSKHPSRETFIGRKWGTPSPVVLCWPLAEAGVNSGAHMPTKALDQPDGVPILPSG